MLQGIYLSLRSTGNLSSGLRPRNFIFKIFQSPAPPPLIIIKKEWAVLYPKYILFSLTFNSKLAQGWGRGLGGVNRVWLRVSAFPLPTELSNRLSALRRKTGSSPILTWKKNVFWAKAIEWITVLNICNKRHEKVHVYIIMENLN